MMALRATRNWRWMMSRSFATSTTPRMNVFAPTVDAAHQPKSWAAKAEHAPVCMMLGMVAVAMTLAAHTAKQQLRHHPGVQVTKKKRESVPEVEDPDHSVASADKFVNKSFLRKVAHIQDHDRTLSDPVRPDPFTRPRNAETLKTAGVDPGRRN